MTSIMVVDDEEKIRTLLCKTLEGKGYLTQNADSGETALEKIKTENFDLIISDVNMPTMDGVTLLKNIKEINKNLPVLFMTALGMEQTLKEAIQLGLDGYVEKPFNMNSLLELIEEKLKAKQRN